MKIKMLVMAIVLSALALLSSARGDPASQPVLDLSSPGVENRFLPNADGVVVAPSRDQNAPGVVVTIHPGTESFPGVNLKPENGAWDLSRYGHFEARIVNTSARPIKFGIRIDNANWKESNCENYDLEPGSSVVAKVIFGFSYRQPGYALNPSRIQNVIFFVNKSDADQSFRIETIQAAGPAGERWGGMASIEPSNGLIFGHGVTLDPTSQIESTGGARAAMDGAALKISFSGLPQPQSVMLKPVSGQAWDLRNAVEVRVKIRNVGPTAVNSQIKIISNGGATDEAGLAAPLEPGREGEIITSFIPRVPWQGINDYTRAGYDGQPNTGTKFTSDTVNAISLSTDGQAGPQSLLVESIQAAVPLVPLPDWIGRRPPVAGDWIKTFDEEFSGDSVDSSKWNIYTKNYWDQRCHFSRDNVIIGAGVAKLRFERRTGYQNDDPSQKQTDYATGYLDTFGKWVQRYGYFEARMKLPKSPGLWPAFWLVPDRGSASGPQAIRCSTGNGGMEFDILEYLSRWGPYRYNIAMHWDYVYGQKVDHQTGSPCNYVVPDKDGYITAGLLWLPGQAIYYANGHEVLRWETPRISHVESYIIFTAISGGWDNDCLVDSKLPGDFAVDYVRVWQRKDLASSADGYK